MISFGNLQLVIPTVAQLCEWIYKSHWIITLFIYFSGPGFWTQSLALVKQAFYHLSKTPPFLNSFFFFFNISCFFKYVFAWSQSLTKILIPIAPARITGTHHHAWLIGLYVVLLTFCMDCAQTIILLISASETISVSHHAQLNCATCEFYVKKAVTTKRV
jgi:hypothetical protein